MSAPKVRLRGPSGPRTEATTRLAPWVPVVTRNGNLRTTSMSIISTATVNPDISKKADPPSILIEFTLGITQPRCNRLMKIEPVRIRI